MLFQKLKPILLPALFVCLFISSVKAENTSFFNTQDTTCLAFFSYMPKDGNTIELFNLSLGDYQIGTWTMGDGNLYTNPDFSFTHSYESPGLYEICLTISDTISCSSQFCLPVFTISDDTLCEVADCVLPGDTDKDGAINIFDALGIGLGFNLEGAARPDASLEAIMQAAFDWLNSLFDGLDSKHADCDGNGIINELDFLAIDQNYEQVEKNTALAIDAEQPTVTLAFESDTLVMEGIVGNAVTIPATLSVGSEEYPIEDFYGIALSFDYQKSQVQDIQTSILSETSFSSTPIFKEDKIFKDEQYGVALSQTQQMGKEVFGPIAEVGFIIIEDLSDARTINIDISINDIKLIDSKGKEIYASVANDSIHLTILPIESRTVVTNTEEVLGSNISISPNPTTDHLQITLDGPLQNKQSQLLIYNSIGTQVLKQSHISTHTSLDISHLHQGIYWVELLFEEGRVSRQIVVSK